MRKGFQKLAAELLVEATQQDAAIAVEAGDESPNKTGAVVTVDQGAEERRYYVEPADVASIEKSIDNVGLSSLEMASSKEAPPNLGAVQAWVRACTEGESESYARLNKIVESHALADRSCLSDFGKYKTANLVSGNFYNEKKPLIVDLARFVPTVSVISRTTGPGEFAVAFLFGLVPSRATGFDLVDDPTSGRQYTIKHESEAPDLEKGQGLNKFIYKFTGKKKRIKKINDALGSNLAITEDEAKLMYTIREKFFSSTLKPYEKSAKQTRRVFTKRELTYILLDITPRIRKAGVKNPARWALICNNPPPKSQDSAGFTFKAFSLTNKIEAVETALESGRESKIDIQNSQIVISESVSSGTLISELSRRDQQDVEEIARRIAQEVLEDELGDDFDKAVRREMISSFKDKDVESGVADISRDFMRKFYRTLGTASSSPLDKVKV